MKLRRSLIDFALLLHKIEMCLKTRFLSATWRLIYHLIELRLYGFTFEKTLRHGRLQMNENEISISVDKMHH